MDSRIVRAVPLITLIGSLIGIYAFFNVWAFGLTGVELLSCDYEGWEKFIPTVVTVLNIIVIMISLLGVIIPRLWYMPFIGMVFGIAIMVLTSLFSMWYVGVMKAANYAGNGLWLSYAAGAVIILAAAVLYASMCKPRRY